MTKQKRIKLTHGDHHVKTTQEATPKAYSARSAATLIANDIMCMLGGAKSKQPKITRLALMYKDPSNALVEKSAGGLCKEALVGRIQMAIARHGIAVIG